MEFGIVKRDEQTAVRLRVFSAEQFATNLSCPAQAGHPVITNVSDYWIARIRGR
jgi:hypothetical protein